LLLSEAVENLVPSCSYTVNYRHWLLISTTDHSYISTSATGAQTIHRDWKVNDVRSQQRLYCHLNVMSRELRRWRDYACPVPDLCTNCKGCSSRPVGKAGNY
jgi:hypothetical protein